MKWPLVALLLSLVTVNIFAQPNKTPASNKDSAASYANEAPTLKNNHETDAYTGTSPQSSPPWYTSPEWWIVIIAGLTGIFIGVQAREMRKTTEAIQKSTERQLRAYVI